MLLAIMFHRGNDILRLILINCWPDKYAINFILRVVEYYDNYTQMEAIVYLAHDGWNVKAKEIKKSILRKLNEERFGNGRFILVINDAEDFKSIALIVSINLCDIIMPHY